MVKTLTRLDGKLFLEMDQSILDQLRINEGTPLDVRTIGGGLVVEPQRDTIPDEEFNRAAEEIHRRYAETFRRLAE